MAHQDPENVIRYSANFFKLKRRLLRKMGQAIDDYTMIEHGDVVLACVSGGKDSFTMLELLRDKERRAPIDFEIIAMNLDQRQPGFPEHVLPDYFQRNDYRYHIEAEDTYSVVQDKIPKGKTTCSLCSRLRRGIIYRVAKELGANKIALGHHREDMVETLFLNMFFGGKMKSMPPKLITDDAELIVIRPLAYCWESEIARYARAMDFPIIPCNLCGSQQNMQRQEIKKMLQAWERQYPGRVKNIFRAMQHVTRSHLADTALYDFENLSTNTQALSEWIEKAAKKA